MKKLEVLLVEDNSDDIEALQRNICRNEVHLFGFDIASNFAECKEKLEEGGKNYDIVFLDLGLPEFQGLEALKQYLSLKTMSPTVILTGQYNEKIVNYALTNGIQDYIVKSRVNSENIIRIIEYSITRHRLQAELYHKVEELEKKSVTILDKTQKILKLIKDMQKPILYALQESKVLANTPLQPEQDERLHKIVSSVCVMKALIEELEEQEKTAGDEQDNLPRDLDELVESTVRKLS